MRRGNSTRDTAIPYDQFHKGWQVDGLAQEKADTESVAFCHGMRRGKRGKNKDDRTLLCRQVVQLLENREGVVARDHQINQQGIRLFP